MLLRLLPDQVARYWDEIKECVEAALPPIAHSEDRMNNILASALAGGIVCWVSFRKLEEGAEITGIVLTQVISDQISMSKSLLLYALFSPDDSLGADGWAEGYKAFQEYGKSVGCEVVTGYTNDKKVIAMAERYGGDTSYRFISVPL